MPFKRDERNIVVIQPAARKTLESWLADVTGSWAIHWRGRTDHPYGRLSTFLGERFLTDFDFREAERRARS